MPRGHSIPNYEKLPQASRLLVDRAMESQEFASGYIVANIEQMQRTSSECRAKREQVEASQGGELEKLKATRWKLLGAILLLAFAIPVLVEVIFRLQGA